MYAVKVCRRHDTTVSDAADCFCSLIVFVSCANLTCVHFVRLFLVGLLSWIIEARSPNVKNVTAFMSSQPHWVLSMDLESVCKSACNATSLNLDENSRIKQQMLCAYVMFYTESMHCPWQCPSCLRHRQLNTHSSLPEIRRQTGAFSRNIKKIKAFT